jgi:hypothetical protein
MSKDFPEHRLATAADLLDARQVSMRPDLDKALAAWLRFTVEQADQHQCGCDGPALEFADLLLEKP